LQQKQKVNERKPTKEITSKCYRKQPARGRTIRKV